MSWQVKVHPNPAGPKSRNIPYFARAIALKTDESPGSWNQVTRLKKTRPVYCFINRRGLSREVAEPALSR